MQDIATCRQNEAQHSELDDCLLSLSDEDSRRAKKSAHGALEALLRSDAALLFPPAQLGFAALRSAFLKLDIRLRVYLDSVVRKSGGDNTDNSIELKAALTEIDKLGVGGATDVSGEVVAPLDRALKIHRKALATVAKSHGSIKNTV
jgi:hypothetical protein